MYNILAKSHSVWSKTIQQGLTSSTTLVHALLVFSLFSFQSAAEEQPVLVLNAVAQPPLNNSTHDGFMDEVSREAMNRIGYTLVIDVLPAERALRNANSGLIDGEMSRIKGLDKIYPNLIRVPEKIMDWEFFAFSTKPVDVQQGWKSLADKNVAFVTGWKILEKNVPKDAHIIKTRNSKLLFELLKKDRTDIAIYERWGGNHLIDTLRIKNASLQFPELAMREMFIYLHKKHHAIVSKLSQALVDMKKDGSYERLVRKHLTRKQNNKE